MEDPEEAKDYKGLYLTSRRIATITESQRGMSMYCQWIIFPIDPAYHMFLYNLYSFLLMVLIIFYPSQKSILYLEDKDGGSGRFGGGASHIIWN
ncbi:MAG: hypothetical protein WC119_00445 [Synergistaceae bacterium]